MQEALGKADRHLGRFDMFSEYVPNLDLFIQMHVAKEPTKSSRIEDSRTEIEEAILPEEEIAMERRVGEMPCLSVPHGAGLGGLSWPTRL